MKQPLIKSFCRGSRGTVFSKRVPLVAEGIEKNLLWYYNSVEILFIHGPKSSGKTILLDKLLEQLKKEQKLDDEELLRDMVRNNTLYFGPIEAIYYTQGKSYQWGIRIYFEGLS